MNYILTFKDLKEKVDNIIERAVLYDSECIKGLKAELEQVGNPIVRAIKDLEKERSVKRYIELKQQSDYVNSRQYQLSGHYHN